MNILFLKQVTAFFIGWGAFFRENKRCYFCLKAKILRLIFLLLPKNQKYQKWSSCFSAHDLDSCATICSYCDHITVAMRQSKLKMEMWNNIANIRTFILKISSLVRTSGNYQIWCHPKCFEIDPKFFSKIGKSSGKLTKWCASSIWDWYLSSKSMEIFLNGAKLSLNYVNFTNSGKLINHWSMNWAQFKDPTFHMCLAGAVVLYWSLTQEVAGFEPFYCNDKYFCPWIRCIQWNI